MSQSLLDQIFSILLRDSNRKIELNEYFYLSRNVSILILFKLLSSRSFWIFELFWIFNLRGFGIHILNLEKIFYIEDSKSHIF